MSKNVRETKLLGLTILRLYDTDIVEVDFINRKIILNSGGWRTATTKRHMNNAINPLGWHVAQVGGTWYVGRVADFDADPVVFTDGMELAY